MYRIQVLIICLVAMLGSHLLYAKGAIDGRTFDKLLQAQELSEAGNYTQALEILNSVRNRDSITGYARSQLWNFYGYVYASQDNYRQAIAAYKKVISEAETPAGLLENARYSIAQMYYQLGDYQAVIQFMEKWLGGGVKPTATAHVMLAQAYYHLRQFQSALINVERALNIEAQQGKPLREDWLQLKASLSYEGGDLNATINAYEQLMRYFPRVRYLRQLSGLYSEQGNHKKRLSSFDAIYEHGALQNENEILNLAYMYLGMQSPYKAGAIIEKGIKNGVISNSFKHQEILANAWAQANEHKKAIPALENAAKQSGKGLLYARLAGVYFDAGKYQQAAAAAAKADKLGGLKRRDANLMLQGMALFNQKKYESALQIFRRAKKFKASFSAAKKWESYTISEIKYQQAVADNRRLLEQQTRDALEADENTLETFQLAD